MKPKKCKQCKSEFAPQRPLQYICSPACAGKYANELRLKKEKKEWKDKWGKIKISSHAKEFKSEFGREVRKLSRMIDARFGYDTCIDCDKPFGKQTDAAHFHGRGGNSTLSYHLDNIHSARAFCNQISDRHKQDYEIGLAKRYGQEYATYVIDELPLKYKVIHLSDQDIHDKLKLVRSIIRNFDTYSLESSLQARKLFNNLINIYT